MSPILTRASGRSTRKSPLPAFLSSPAVLHGQKLSPSVEGHVAAVECRQMHITLLRSLLQQVLGGGLRQ